MVAVFVVAGVLIGCSVGAGTMMAKRGEPFKVWAVLGFTMGPLVIPYARQFLGLNRSPAAVRAQCAARGDALRQAGRRAMPFPLGGPGLRTDMGAQGRS